MKKILVVDDSEGVREYLAEELRSANFDLEEASDGLEAFDIISKDKDKDIALILSDYNMPHCNGLELVTKLGEKGFLEDIKFIIFSGQELGFLEEEARELGVTAWIKKPIDTDKLIHQIKKILDQ